MTRKLDKHILILDVEATCWKNDLDQPTGEISEIIEVGGVVLDTNNIKVIDTFSIIVKPQHSTISNFCTELTTLTQAQVGAGVSFQEACGILEHKYKANSRTFASWGDYDRNQFKKNCEDYNCKYPFGPRHINIKNLFSTLYGYNKEYGVSQALDKINMKFQGTQHRGIDDALNISNIFINILKQFRK